MDFNFSWMVYKLLELLLIILFLITITYFVRRQHLKRPVQYTIIAGLLVLSLVFILSSFGYHFNIVLGFIEWTTKFVLPWLVLYWLVRAVNIYEKK
ncbi:hypothetical protein [Salipaludibacillus sp. CF4.18]|uniref:hypothetical protein n=1 Tax=Salipaludibacillus sp. CF4.18 TaxID=3373081 RepID=UPI003EE5FF26